MRIQLSRETIGRAFEMRSRRFRLLGRSLVGCGFCGTRVGTDASGSSSGPGLFRQPQPARHPHYYKNRA